MTSVVSDVAWRNVGKGLIFVFSLTWNKLISHFTLDFSVETRAQEEWIAKGFRAFGFLFVCFCGGDRWNCCILSQSLNINQKLLGDKLNGKFKRMPKKKGDNKKNAALNDWDGTPFLITAFFDKLKCVLGGGEPLEDCQYEEIQSVLEFSNVKSFQECLCSFLLPAVGSGCWEDNVWVYRTYRPSKRSWIPSQWIPFGFWQLWQVQKGREKEGSCICWFPFSMPFLFGTWKIGIAHNSNLPLQEADI